MFLLRKYSQKGLGELQGEKFVRGKKLANLSRFRLSLGCFKAFYIINRLLHGKYYMSSYLLKRIRKILQAI